jgi:hypothetical protein
MGWLARVASQVFRYDVLENGTRKVEKDNKDEKARQAGCREVVLSYANHLGYIARECMSRDEIEELIDGGIDPKALANEIQARINARPGITLGKQLYNDYEMKLPYSWRDRHMYIVGRSGSGKTNLIRNMLRPRSWDRPLSATPDN